MPGSSLNEKKSELEALEQRGYVIGKQIGQGSYATVHTAEYIDGINCKKIRLACKVVDKGKAPQDFLEKFFPRELQIITRIENPNIIQVHSILQRGSRVFIFMRYAENGDLLEFIKRNGPIPEAQVRIWFRQLSEGLQYLHKLNIAHRDLKCENVLLSQRYNAKLADFGFARFCSGEDNRRVLSRTYCGSAAYAAPEVVSGIPYNPKIADIWSLGVVLYVMFNATMPFDDSNLRRLLKNQRARSWDFRQRLKGIISNNGKALVRQILEPDITLRPSLEMILTDIWLKSCEGGSKTNGTRVKPMPFLLEDKTCNEDGTGEKL